MAESDSPRARLDELLDRIGLGEPVSSSEFYDALVAYLASVPSLVTNEDIALTYRTVFGLPEPPSMRRL